MTLQSAAVRPVGRDRDNEPLLFVEDFRYLTILA